MEYTIKEVTKKYNLSASTLRYYEKEGLLPKIKKNQTPKREIRSIWKQNFFVLAWKQVG